MCLGMDMRAMFPVCKRQEICAKKYSQKLLLEFR